MKHLIIQDHNLSYLVYFRPKDKAKMYETIYKAQQDFWSHNYNYELLDYITLKLNEQGFKVCDLSQEIKHSVYIRSEFSENAFWYKNIRVRESAFGFYFVIKNTHYTGKTIAECIAIIDKETEK